MTNIGLIGAGRLGSRHLQGVLKSALEFELFVVDPNEKSLHTAQVCANEVEHSKKVQYCLSMNELPEVLDLVIVATGADVRLAVVQQLLSLVKVKNLVLEKVLFQKLDDYKVAQRLFETNNINVWVNHARRYYEPYQRLKKAAFCDHNTRIGIYGQNWGLGCNALHFLDLIEFIANEEIQSLDLNQLDKTVRESKRDKFVEFSGVITGVTTGGVRFSISSNYDENKVTLPITMSLLSSHERVLVHEGGKISLISAKVQERLKAETTEYTWQHQSELSGYMVDDILTRGNIVLPSYKEASITHQKFISKLLNIYSEITNQNQELCPIT